MKILMVCLGNICRSPLAEGIMRKKIEENGLNWQVDSAGTMGYNIGCAPHPLSQKIALINNIDISNQTCRLLTETDFELFDKIYVMDRNNYKDTLAIAGKNQVQKVILLMNELFPGEDREVPDPYYGQEENYHEVYKMIDKACDAILSRLTVKATD